MSLFLSKRDIENKYSDLSFRMESILQELAPSHYMGVAGRHRALPSVSLDKHAYLVVFHTTCTGTVLSMRFFKLFVQLDAPVIEYRDAAPYFVDF